MEKKSPGMGMREVLVGLAVLQGQDPRPCDIISTVRETQVSMDHQLMGSSAVARRADGRTPFHHLTLQRFHPTWTPRPWRKPRKGA